jgi:hypothetical protein
VGCFDAPPQYSEPTRVPPVIVADDCKPPLTEVYITTGNSADFTVAFRADDAGLSLSARAVRDITIGTPRYVDDKPIAPDERAFADQDVRSVTLHWQWTAVELVGLKGCHAVTVIIADASSFKSLYETKDILQEARMTWFVWLSDPSAAPDEMLVNKCAPNSAGVPQ